MTALFFYIKFRRICCEIFNNDLDVSFVSYFTNEFGRVTSKG